MEGGDPSASYHRSRDTCSTLFQARVWRPDHEALLELCAAESRQAKRERLNVNAPNREDKYPVWDAQGPHGGDMTAF